MLNTVANSLSRSLLLFRKGMSDALTSETLIHNDDRIVFQTRNMARISAAKNNAGFAAAISQRHQLKPQTHPSSQTNPVALARRTELL